MVTRQALGLSQAKLAKQLGIGQVVMCQYEKRHRRPSPEVLLKMAVALGLDAVEGWRWLGLWYGQAPPLAGAIPLVGA